ncbi:MAG: site-specific DNA-methyltransferase [Actinobacteria bacterium]|uniref:site-specific DNA-methyltransferase (cytosine-N(4)-specific) n=1 Tax=freshwater metagenome TaxID=449393 RepID=A0A6J7QQD1_9ZZZZ|nr:site-specific DNA-methyltransferase [Actinomycetota bacterium]MSX09828.1 site-specific DNA-methyltransferase [Actinomycetota bacterium]
MKSNQQALSFGDTYQRGISSTFNSANEDHVIFNGDARDLMKSMPDESVKLVITSPPYNIGKVYENPVSLEEYLEEQMSITNELIRVLHPQGSLCWEVGNYVNKGEIVPLDIPFYNIFKKHGLKLRNRIVWTFGHGLHASKRFSGRYETILWFTKEDNYTFNLDPVRVPSKYPGKRNYKGDKKGEPSGNPLGKNPSDIWTFIAQDWEREIWDIPNVKANHPEKTSHPCQFPVELVQRCILALTNENDIVLDPFGGIGTSVLASDIAARRGIMADLQSDYCEMAVDRIGQMRDGSLKIRPIGTPVFKPTGKEKVSQVPEEWLGLVK